MDGFARAHFVAVSDADYLFLDFLKGCSAEELAEIMEIRGFD